MVKIVSPILTSSTTKNRNHKRKQVKQLAKTLDIIEQQLSVGDVKTISNGNIIKYIELLFSPTTKVQFAPSDDNRSMRLSVSDNNLEMPES